MKQIQNNLHYFEISKNSAEDLLDENYIFDEIHPNLDKYVDNTKEVKNLLITIKTLQDKGEEAHTVDKYFTQLASALGDFSNCSEFGCFINACDNIITGTKNNLELLKKITKRYFSKRILNEIVPKEWVQAILDSNSARKKGKCGEKKLIHILTQQGFNEVFDWNEFSTTDYCAVKFSTKFNLKNVRRQLNVSIKTKKQNKTLDLIIKAKDRVFFCEAKHLNTSGGGQDKQISELIEILRLNESKEFSYIAFLDGNYSNILLNNSSGGPKISTQRREINKFLKKNPNNYWLNTAGFKALIADIK